MVKLTKDIKFQITVPQKDPPRICLALTPPPPYPAYTRPICAPLPFPMFFLLRPLRRVLASVARHASDASAKNCFQLFPKTFPGGGPPKDLFLVDLRTLRKEFRQLQSQHHPDILAPGGNNQTGTNGQSSLINRAYSVVKNPYTRVAHTIELLHPKHFDITVDETSRQLIEQLKARRDSDLDYEELLMTVLDAHEALEMAAHESDLDALQTRNDERIAACEGRVAELLQASPVDWEKTIAEAIRLKYWANIANGIKEWEQDKPVLLTH